MEIWVKLGVKKKLKGGKQLRDAYSFRVAKLARSC